MHNVALIGAGSAGTWHQPGWQKVPDARLAVVVDIDPERASDRAAKWGGVAPATDYRTVLADPGITICDICLPHSLHAPIAVDCLRAGKHVLLEKPIALNLAEAAAIIAAEKESGKVLMVAENCYYAPAVTKAAEILRAGTVGELHDVRGRLEYPGLRAYVEPEGAADPRAWRRDVRRSGGGMVFDGGTHLVSVARMFMGEVESVAAMERAGPGGELPAHEDTFHAITRFSSGACGAFDFVSDSGGEEVLVRLSLLGTGGVLELDLWSGTVKVIRFKEIAEYALGPWGGFAEEIAHFMECVRTGAEPRSSARDQSRSLALVLAAYESARKGGVPVRPGTA